MTVVQITYSNRSTYLYGPFRSTDAARQWAAGLQTRPGSQVKSWDVRDVCSNTVPVCDIA